MGVFAFGTTGSDSGLMELEDLVSIPDLVAGALCNVMTKYKIDSVLPTGKVLVPPPSSVSPKDREIMGWYSDNTQPLKRYFYLINGNDSPEDLTLHEIGSFSANDMRPNPA
jgi:hypothetical protein